jgi:hypothetical protein
MINTPSLSNVLDDAQDSRLNELHVSIPGRIEAYDAGSGRATVQPLVKRGYIDEQGDRQVETLPVVTDVPVLFLGAGGFRFTLPVSVGDVVLLVFTSCSIDRWLVKGGLVDPQDDRRHCLSDAIAIPGLRDFGHAWSSPASDVASIGHDAGAQITFRQQELRLGGDNASQFIPLMSDLVALKQAITSWTPVAGDGGAALKTILTALFASWPVGSTKVKAE